METFSRRQRTRNVAFNSMMTNELAKESKKKKDGKNLLIGAECVATCAAVLAWIQLALLHIVGARSALETFRTMTFEIATGQRCTCAAIVTRR